jgi:hypothetical protein
MENMIFPQKQTYVVNGVEYTSAVEAFTEAVHAGVAVHLYEGGFHALTLNASEVVAHWREMGE